MASATSDSIGGLGGSVAIKAPVRAATTANITLSGLQTIDGVVVVAGDRVLVKDQTTTSENGIYATSSGTWLRTRDFDGSRDVVKGTRIFTTDGTVNANAEYIVTNANPIVIGASSLTFSLFFDAESVSHVLPSISGGARKLLQVKVDETGYQLQGLEHYNVKDFGAIGNGSADDFAAINAALTAATALSNGVGAVFFPPGQYAVSQTINLTTNRSRLIGMGARIQSRTLNVAPVTVNASLCILEDLILYNPFRPTISTGCLNLEGGADNTYRKLSIIGGHYGIYGTGGGDSYFEDIKVSSCYSDFIRLEGYNGFWGFRCKCDASWPVATPVSANYLGNWAATTAYTVNQIVIFNNWAFQCSVGGTSGTSGPKPDTFGVGIVDGTVTWKTAMTNSRAGIRIESDSFINAFITSDFTGGHFYGAYLSDTTGANEPQSVFFEHACEFGQPLLGGLRIDAAQNVNLNNMFVDGGIVSTSYGISMGAGSVGLKVRGCTIHGFATGLAVLGDNTLIADNTIVGCSANAVSIGADVEHFNIHDNMMADMGFWGANGTCITVAAGASDHYKITGNNVEGFTVAGIVDNGTGVDKVVRNNPGAADDGLLYRENLAPKIAAGTLTLNVGNAYAGTLTKMAGKITTDALTTAAGASQALVITNTQVTTATIVTVSRSGGSNSAGTPIFRAVPTANTLTITIKNHHAADALNGTLIVDFIIFKP